MIEVDVRGYSCPIPVIRSKEAMNKHPAEEIHVLIDEEVSRENVSRMAENAGWTVERGDSLDIRLVPGSKEQV
jgi:tRNA 2-thiouridine synthesizing protein A